MLFFIILCYNVLTNLFMAIATAILLTTILACLERARRTRTRGHHEPPSVQIQRTAPCSVMSATWCFISCDFFILAITSSCRKKNGIVGATLAITGCYELERWPTERYQKGRTARSSSSPTRHPAASMAARTRRAKSKAARLSSCPERKDDRNKKYWYGTDTTE